MYLAVVSINLHDIEYNYIASIHVHVVCLLLMYPLPIHRS